MISSPFIKSSSLKLANPSLFKSFRDVWLGLRSTGKPCQLSCESTYWPLYEHGAKMVSFYMVVESSKKTESISNCGIFWQTRVTTEKNYRSHFSKIFSYPTAPLFCQNEQTSFLSLKKKKGGVPLWSFLYLFMFGNS